MAYRWLTFVHVTLLLDIHLPCAACFACAADCRFKGSAAAAAAAAAAGGDKPKPKAEAKPGNKAAAAPAAAAAAAAAAPAAEEQPAKKQKKEKVKQEKQEKEKKKDKVRPGGRTGGGGCRGCGDEWGLALLVQAWGSQGGTASMCSACWQSQRLACVPAAPVTKAACLHAPLLAHVRWNCTWWPFINVDCNEAE
jgi:hypothetical protein